jgi:ferric enterobactin receptor
MRTSYYWALSDERLKPEFAEHVSFGIAFDRNAYLLKIHLYQKKSKNLLFLIPTIYSDAYLYSSAMHEAIHSTSDMIYIDRGASTSRGIEFLLQKKYGAISGGLTYQIGKSEYQFQTINQGHLFLAEYDRTHEINWVTQFAWRNWMLSLSTIFATGTPFSTAEHTVFGSPIEHDFYAYCDRSVINNERLPSYNRFDIKLSHRIRIFSLCELEYGCTLLNLFNQTNVIDRYYQNAEDMKNNQVTDITEPGRTLFIFCNLSH